MSIALLPCYWCGNLRPAVRQFDPCKAAQCFEETCELPRGHDRGEHEPGVVRSHVRATRNRIEDALYNLRQAKEKI